MIIKETQRAKQGKITVLQKFPAKGEGADSRRKAALRLFPAVVAEHHHISPESLLVAPGFRLEFAAIFGAGFGRGLTTCGLGLPPCRWVMALGSRVRAAK